MKGLYEFFLQAKCSNLPTNILGQAQYSLLTPPNSVGILLFHLHGCLANLHATLRNPDVKI